MYKEDLLERITRKNQTILEIKDELRKSIEEDQKKFLDNGGVIQKLNSNQSNFMNITSKFKIRPPSDIDNKIQHSKLLNNFGVE